MIRTFTRFVGLAIVLIAVALVPALTAQEKKQDTSPLAGRWNMTVEAGAHGVVSMQLELKQDGRKVTGTFSSPHGDLPVEGEFAGGTLKLKTTGGDMHVTFEARLDGADKLAGYMSSEMGDMKWSAERAK